MKHPFTANNMQMLAYKILRGNYEQVGPKFSYDLRNLVSAMLKRNPRERPSVNGILRKAFIMKRCDRFLTNEKMKEEFSHTVLHGENFARKIKDLELKPRVTPRPNSAARGPMIAAAACASPMPQKALYDPAKVYNAPVVRRSDQQLRKSIDKRNAVYNEMKKKAPINNRPASVTLNKLKNKVRNSYDGLFSKKKNQNNL